MNSLEKKKKQFIVASLVIPMLLLVGFVVFPAFDLFRMSFTDWDGYSQSSNVVGLANYVTMFQNKDLWLSLRNNAIYFVVHLCMIVVELAFAVLLTSKLRAAKFYKTMVFLPYIINGVAIAYAFSYFFSPINGAFDAILSSVHLESLIRSWLSDEKVVNFVLAFVSLWRFSGYHVILFMAALQVFDIPFVMTAGGPGYASSTFTLYTIKTAFTFSNFGLASTMAVAIMVMIVLAPIVLTLFAALKTKTAVTLTSPMALPGPDEVTFDNFMKVLTDKYLLLGFKNTIIIIAVSLVFNVIFGTMTAFIMERFEFRGKKIVTAFFFIGMLIPSFVTEIARFRIIQGLHLYNTLGAPIVIYIAADLMQLYIYRQFIQGLPVALDEAALLDGCSYFGLFTKIIFPLLKPATATVCIIKAINIINDMYVPLYFT